MRSRRQLPSSKHLLADGRTRSLEPILVPKNLSRTDGFARRRAVGDCRSRSLVSLPWRCKPPLMILGRICPR
jgi:hypothetical protein